MSSFYIFCILLFKGFPQQSKKSDASDQRRRSWKKDWRFYRKEGILRHLQIWDIDIDNPWPFFLEGKAALCKAPTLETRPHHNRLTLETLCPNPGDKCVVSLTLSDYHVTMKMQETGPTVCSPYPTICERLTIRRYNYKGIPFSVILRPWLLVRSVEFRTLGLPRSILALYQVS